MEHTLKISVPDELEPWLQRLDNVDAFVSAIVNDALDNQSERQKLAEAAQLALDDYKNDKELTAFTALDGEPFYE